MDYRWYVTTDGEICFATKNFPNDDNMININKLRVILYDEGKAGTYFDDYNLALKYSTKLKTILNAKNHIAITSMANSIMLTTFYLYADSDKNSIIDKEKLKLAMRELLRCQALYVKTNSYDKFDDIALQDLKDIYDLMEQEDKDNIKDNLEIYSWFEPKAPFIEFYKKIGGVI